MWKDEGKMMANGTEVVEVVESSEVKPGKELKKGTTVIRTAYDNPLFKEKYPNGVTVAFTYDQYNTDEAAAATLKTGELASVLTARSKGNARSQAIADFTKPYAPKEDDPAEVRKAMVKTFMLANKKLTPAQAEAMADKAIAAAALAASETE